MQLWLIGVESCSEASNLILDEMSKLTAFRISFYLLFKWDEKLAVVASHIMWQEVIAEKMIVYFRILSMSRELRVFILFRWAETVLRCSLLFTYTKIEIWKKRAQLTCKIFFKVFKRTLKEQLLRPALKLF